MDQPHGAEEDAQKRAACESHFAAPPGAVQAVTRAQGRLSRAVLGPRRLALLSLLGNVVLVGFLVMRGAPQPSLLRSPPPPPPPSLPWQCQRPGALRLSEPIALCCTRARRKASRPGTTLSTCQHLP